MNETEIYEVLKEYYERGYQQLVRSPHRTPMNIEYYLVGICELSLFAQFLGISFKDSKELYELYRKKVENLRF